MSTYAIVTMMFIMNSGRKLQLPANQMEIGALNQFFAQVCIEIKLTNKIYATYFFPFLYGLKTALKTTLLIEPNQILNFIRAYIKIDILGIAS